MNKNLTLGIALFGAIFVLFGCGGNGTVTPTTVRFQVPDSVGIITNGYVAGDLVVSARFLSSDSVEITSATYRYSYNGENYAIPSSRGNFTRRANGEWMQSSSTDLAGRYQIANTVKAKNRALEILGHVFTPAPLIHAQTAAVRYPLPERLQEHLPILAHNSPSWCQGDFRPEWVVTMSSDGKRILTIGSPDNSTHTRADGSVELPMAILEKG